MKTQQLSIALAVFNLGLLIFLLVTHRGALVSNDVAAVVRCRAFQVVDDQGRTRASISVLPASTFKPTGKPYPDPETVIFRLIDAKGRPEVKIGASEEGAGLGFVGDADETQVKLEAMGSESSLTLLNKNGKQQQVKP
jgi:hypothetical protein